MRFSTTFLTVLLFAVFAAAEEENSKTSLGGRPQPRQIFRGGLDDNRKKYQTGRRFSLQNRRNRNRDSEDGNFAITPTPKVENSRFQPNSENNNQKLNHEVEVNFKNENSQFQNIVENEEEEKEKTIVTERAIEETSDFADDYISKEKKEVGTNFLESEDYHETRSPAHRYSDEKYASAEYKRSTPSLPAYQLTSASEERVKVTRRPIQKNDYNPFSQFSPIESKSLEEDTPVKLNSQERYQHSPSIRRFQEQRFSNQQAEERKFETRPATQKQSPPNYYQPQRDAPVRKTFSSRPSQRFINRIQNNNQLQHQNQIPANNYPEENFRSNSNRPKHESNREEVPYYQDSEYYDGGDYDDDEPDRLSELLIVSKFSCSNRKDGYYADEHVDCEVFHFCQDGVKHSWLCPNDAAFHQVHLICMPRSEDNICAKSSKFHFVNDFLYKEVGNHPENRSYVERYYPRGYQGGVANIPEYDDGEVPPQAESTRPYRQRQYQEAPQPPPSYSNRRKFEGQHSTRDERVPVNDQTRNGNPREVEQSESHSYKQQRPKFHEKRQQVQQFASEVNVPQGYFQQHRPAPVQKVQERPFKRPTFQQQPREKISSFEPEEEKQQFKHPKFQPSRRHPGPPIFEERQSANLAVDQPMPSKLPTFQEAQAIEHRPRNPSPQRPSDDLHVSPVFRSQDRPSRAPFYSNPNRNLQTLQSIRQIHRQKAPEQYGMIERKDSPSFTYDG